MKKSLVIGTAFLLSVFSASTAFAATTTTTKAHSTTKKTTVHTKAQTGAKSSASAKIGFSGGGFLSLSSIASDLGITESTLESDLKSGKTIEQIAESQNVSQQQLITDLTNSAKTQLQKLVSSGKLSSTKEQQALSQLSKSLPNFLTHTLAKHGTSHGTSSSTGTSSSHSTGSSNGVSTSTSYGHNWSNSWGDGTSSSTSTSVGTSSSASVGTN